MRLPTLSGGKTTFVCRKTKIWWRIFRRATIYFHALSYKPQSDRVSYDHFRMWVLSFPEATSPTRWLLQEPCSVTLSNDLETPTFYQTLAGVTHCKYNQWKFVQKVCLFWWNVLWLKHHYLGLKAEQPLDSCRHRSCRCAGDALTPRPCQPDVCTPPNTQPARDPPCWRTDWRRRQQTLLVCSFSGRVWHNRAGEALLESESAIANWTLWPGNFQAKHLSHNTWAAMWRLVFETSGALDSSACAGHFFQKFYLRSMAKRTTTPDQAYWFVCCRRFQCFWWKSWQSHWLQRNGMWHLCMLQRPPNRTPKM